MTAVQDPAYDRYLIATSDEVRHRQAAEKAAQLRAAAVTELHADMSYSRLAVLLGISRSRAQQLAERGRISRAKGR